LEKRHDDAIALYRRLRKISPHRGLETDKTLAASVAKSHPEAAIEIWQAITEDLIGQAKPRAYEEAAGYLRRMRSLYQQQRRLDHWKALLDGIRQRHKAKRRLMDVLDRLVDRRIAE